MTSPTLNLTTASGTIRIGYRSPQLGPALDADAKMLLATACGMSVIEPQCNQREITNPTQARDYAAAARRHSIAVPSFGCDLPLLTEDLAANQAQLDQALAVAEHLGAGHFFTRVLLPPPEMPQPRAWERLRRHLPPVLDRCRAAGLDCGIEADGGTFITSTERLLHLLTLVDHPALVANFDACNLYLGGSDPLATVETLATRIRNGHIKDGIWHAARHGEVAIGQGELDWHALLGKLRHHDLAVPLFIEHCKSPEQVRAAAEHLRRCLDELQL